MGFGNRTIKIPGVLLVIMLALLSACGEDPTGLESEFTPTPTLTPSPTPWWNPTATPDPNATPTPTPIPTATGIPTSTPTVTPTTIVPTATYTPVTPPTATPTNVPSWPPGADGFWTGQTDAGGEISFYISNQQVTRLSIHIIVPCNEGGACDFVSDAYNIWNTGPNSFAAEDFGQSWRIDGVVLSNNQCGGIWSAPAPIGYCSLFTGKTCGGEGSWSAQK